MKKGSSKPSAKPSAQASTVNLPVENNILLQETALSEQNPNKYDFFNVETKNDREIKETNDKSPPVPEEDERGADKYNHLVRTPNEQDNSENPSPKVEKTPEKPEKEPEEKKEEPNYEKELSKTQERLKESQKSWHEINKKLVNYKKKVAEMMENGDVTESEGNMLLGDIHIDDEPVDDMSKWAEAWDKEIEYIKKYAKNRTDIEKHKAAYIHFNANASDEEVEKSYKDFDKLKDDPTALTEKMLEYGEKYCERFFGEMYEEGGVEKLINKYKKINAEDKKVIEKLEKKVKMLSDQTEGYTEVTTPGIPLKGSEVREDKKIEDPKSKNYLSSILQNRF